MIYVPDLLRWSINWLFAACAVTIYQYVLLAMSLFFVPAKITFLSLMQDITGEYVDATRDAYIPEQRHPHQHLHEKEEEEEAPYRIRIQPHAHRVPVGAAVDMLVAVDYHVWC